MAKILFSPVGGSDPIRGNRDGAMLHIIRHYQPDTVYLYLTKEMNENEEKDRRYTKAITALSKRLKKNIEVIVKSSEITEAHDFDAFQKEYPEIIEEIFSRYSAEDNQVYVNITSGTPQMMNSIVLEVATGNRILIPVQVSTPQKGQNRADGKKEEYDTDREMENNLDNDANSENRCKKSKLQNVKKTVVKSQITSLINEYDYTGALKIFQPAKGLFENPVIVENLLLHTVHRINLQKDLAKPYLRYVGNHPMDFYPVKDKTASDLIDYLHTIEIKQRRGELSDFAIKISPLVVEMAVILLKGMGIYEKITCMDKDKGHIINIKRDMIEKYDPDMMEYLDKKLKKKGGFEDKFFNTFSCNLIIGYLVKKSPDNRRLKIFKEDFSDLSGFEQKIRNLTAHQMVSVTEELLEEKTKMNSKKVLNKLKNLMNCVFPESFKENLFIYDDINRVIIKNLE